MCCSLLLLAKREKKTLEIHFFRLSFTAFRQVFSYFHLVQWWEGLFTLATTSCEHSIFHKHMERYDFELTWSFFCVYVLPFTPSILVVCTQTNKVDLLSRKRWKSYVCCYNFPNSSFICLLFSLLFSSLCVSFCFLLFHWHFDGKECEQHTV